MVVWGELLTSLQELRLYCFALDKHLHQIVSERCKAVQDQPHEPHPDLLRHSIVEQYLDNQPYIFRHDI